MAGITSSLNAICIWTPKIMILVYTIGLDFWDNSLLRHSQHPNINFLGCQPLSSGWSRVLNDVSNILLCSVFIPMFTSYIGAPVPASLVPWASPPPPWQLCNVAAAPILYTIGWNFVRRRLDNAVSCAVVLGRNPHVLSNVTAMNTNARCVPPPIPTPQYHVFALRSCSEST